MSPFFFVILRLTNEGDILEATLSDKMSCCKSKTSQAKPDAVVANKGAKRFMLF